LDAVIRIAPFDVSIERHSQEHDRHLSGDLASVAGTDFVKLASDIKRAVQRYEHLKATVDKDLEVSNTFSEFVSISITGDIGGVLVLGCLYQQEMLPTLNDAANEILKLANISKQLKVRAVQFSGL
jgi:hypothetical protein